MRRRIAAFILSFAFVICLAPGLALAADEGAAAGSTGFEEQASSALVPQASAILATQPSAAAPAQAPTVPAQASANSSAQSSSLTAQMIDASPGQTSSSTVKKWLLVRGGSTLRERTGSDYYRYSTVSDSQGKIGFKQTYSRDGSPVAGTSELYCECTEPPVELTPGESVELENRLYARNVSGYGQYLECQVLWGGTGYVWEDVRSTKADTSSASSQYIGTMLDAGFDEKRATVSVSVPSASYGKSFSIYFWCGAGLYEWQYSLMDIEQAATDDGSGDTAKAKKANPMTAKANTVALKAAKLKAKGASVKATKAFTVKKAKGKVRYKIAKYVTKAAKGKVKVASTGKVTVKKGTPKKTYKVKVKITAAGNSTYKAKSKTVTLVVKVK